MNPLPNTRRVQAASLTTEPLLLKPARASNPKPRACPGIYCFGSPACGETACQKQPAQRAQSTENDHPDADPKAMRIFWGSYLVAVVAFLVWVCFALDGLIKAGQP